MPLSRLPSLALLLLAAGSLAGCYHALPLTPAAVDQSLAPPNMDTVRTIAGTLKHPILRPVAFDDRDGLSPDEAAILAVLANPSLRAIRDGRGVAQAQVLQAGILPNPSVSGEGEFPQHAPGEVNGYTLDAVWDVTSLITLAAKVDASKAQAASVELDIAWQEWQVAQSAKTAVLQCVALEAQLAAAEEVESRLQENAKTVRAAAEKHFKTVVDLAAAEAAFQEAETQTLDVRSDLRKERLALNKALGLAPGTTVRLQADILLPSRITPPPAAELLNGLEDRRLDLVALRRGYENQEATVRAAILAQFPKVELGIHHTRDTGNFVTLGPMMTLDLPIFDRNQGNIAIETATRQKLFDEYTNRVFEARSEIADLLGDLESISEKIARAEAALPALEQLVKTYEAAIANHQVDVLSYYSARNDVAKKRLDILKLKQSLVETRIALEMASGRYLADAPAPVAGPVAAAPESKEVSP
jgi:outer membrane protein, heavy metal efflux system